MKKILAGGLVAALAILPVTGAMAQQVKPLETSKSTQSLGGGDSSPDSLRGGGGDSLQLGTLGGSGLITAAVILIGIGIIASSSNGTN